MSPQEKWDSLEEDEVECLSLSDFPVLVDKPYDIDESKSSGDEDDDDFEFLISADAGGLLCSSNEPDMCAADEVFFQGRILPLRPSAASSLDGTSFAAGSPSASRSDSWDRYSSHSNSSGSSSSSCCCCVSRSHSSSSARSSSSSFEQQQRCRPRPPLSNNFYTHPSPTPQVLSSRKTSSAAAAAGRRKSTNPAPPPPPPVGWSIFRLGLAKAPEIELYASRSRRVGSASGRISNAAAKRAKEEAVRGGGAAKCYPPTVRGGGAAKAQRKAVVNGGRFSCKCSADAMEPIAVTKTTTRRS